MERSDRRRTVRLLARAISIGIVIASIVGGVALLAGHRLLLGWMFVVFGILMAGAEIAYLTHRRLLAGVASVGAGVASIIGGALLSASGQSIITTPHVGFIVGHAIVGMGVGFVGCGAVMTLMADGVAARLRGWGTSLTGGRYWQ